MSKQKTITAKQYEDLFRHDETDPPYTQEECDDAWDPYSATDSYDSETISYDTGTLDEDFKENIVYGHTWQGERQPGDTLRRFSR